MSPLVKHPQEKDPKNCSSPILCSSSLPKRNTTKKEKNQPEKWLEDPDTNCGRLDAELVEQLLDLRRGEGFGSRFWGVGLLGAPDPSLWSME